MYKELTMQRRFIWILLLVCLAALNGCGYLIAAGVGGAGGYILRDQGYEIKSPVEKTDNHKDAKG